MTCNINLSCVCHAMYICLTIITHIHCNRTCFVRGLLCILMFCATAKLRVEGSEGGGGGGGSSIMQSVFSGKDMENSVKHIFSYASTEESRYCDC